MGFRSHSRTRKRPIVPDRSVLLFWGRLIVFRWGIKSSSTTLKVHWSRKPIQMAPAIGQRANAQRNGSNEAHDENGFGNNGTFLYMVFCQPIHSEEKKSNGYGELTCNSTFFRLYGTLYKSTIATLSCIWMLVVQPTLTIRSQNRSLYSLVDHLFYVCISRFRLNEINLLCIHWSQFPSVSNTKKWDK